MKHWLMKAEPESRIVKGKDVKFSVDDFESMKTTPWEGVRNAEARNLMKEMQAGDRVLFYHSNCKNPGIAAFAEVSKEAYPDYTAWDSSHPYYDEKTDQEKPKWYMVDLTLKARAEHFVSLALLKRIAASPSSEPPADVEYIGEEGVKAIKEMALINRGRLSVQRVEDEAWSVIEKLASTGGWEDEAVKKGKKSGSDKSNAVKKGQSSGMKAKTATKNGGEDSGVAGDIPDEAREDKPKKPAAKKRKAEDETSEAQPLRRSTRTRK
ncbi:EVE domain-containing protein [Phanerochaete sordida]|uniref:EVE domain-containing protein n=1 Tax=Phanerochaete sordida TaxID=48140 RepID=A0A9P3G379_9APHY|nr:EVE domain-containing protein [Phanerochaete sordida]